MKKSFILPTSYPTTIYRIYTYLGQHNKIKKTLEPGEIVNVYHAYSELQELVTIYEFSDYPIHNTEIKEGERSQGHSSDF